MTITPITVTGTFGAPETGNPTLGQVVFQLSEAMTDTTTGEIVGPAPEVAQIIDGALSIVLLANDDATTVPPTTTYQVTERIVGAPQRSYRVVVPHDAAAGTVTLAALAASP